MLKGVAPSRPDRFPGSAVPQERCSGCGRKRSLGKKYSSRFECDIYTRYCRRAKGDEPGLKHDPSTQYREREGRYVRLAVEEIEALRGRSDHSISVPHCERDGCPRNGIRMECSGIRLGEIIASVCRGQKRHYEFRHVSNGAVVTKLADGLYQ